MGDRSETKEEGAGAPLYELIYAVLREHILDERFPAGLVLGEAGVARAFQASRVPAGAALKRLHGEGLVRDFGGRGYLTKGGKSTAPIRLDLVKAGLQLPEKVESELRKRNRRERIYPDAEHRVASCLPYGRFQLNESALAQFYGVSRTVAHEVLTRLERTGLVTQDVNKRWYAGPLSEVQLQEHFEMRCLLEPIALRQVATEIPKGEIEEKWARAKKAETSRHTLEKIERLERDLHVDIILRCRNSQLRETIRRSQLVLVAVHHSFDLYRDSGLIGLMIAEHLEILGHLLKGNALASRALEAHLRRSLNQNIEMVRQLGPLASSRRPPYLVPI